MGKPVLYLIDATAFCYRAFYALRNLNTSFGQPTNAIYGVITMLQKILKDHAPQLLAVCFDVSRETFRQKKFAEYKMQRASMPEDLSSQIPLIKEIIRAYGIRIFQKEGFEADDIIATLARKAKNATIPTAIVSSDKDMLQLVDEHTSVVAPSKEESVIYDSSRVVQRYGVAPAQISDLISLMGDASDNIPGIPGIGEKTAVHLIKTFGSLEELLKHYEDIPQEKVRKAIGENIEKVKLNKELTVLDEQVDLDVQINDLTIAPPDYQALFGLFKHLEFKALLNDLPAQEALLEPEGIPRIKDEELKGVFNGEELFCYGNSLETLIFCLKDKVFCLEKIGENIRKILSNKHVPKISHDLKKLKLLFASGGLQVEGLFFDTMIAAYLLDPSKPGYSLSDVAWDYLGKPVQENSLDRAQAIALITQLKPRLTQALKDKSLMNLFAEIEMPLVNVLADMQLSGICVDAQVLSVLSKEVEKRLIGLIEDIYRLSGCHFNINSPKQLREVLFEKLKLPVVKKNKTGPSTDEEVLRTLSVSHELPVLLLEYRQLMKLKTTYIDTLPTLIDSKTGRVHTSFNQTGTETGRLSSSNPNLQNIPIKTEFGRNIRKAFVTSGRTSLLLSCDYSQIELRILAHISGDQCLIEAFTQDKDIHRATASLIYGIQEQQVTEQMRTIAKRVNFGIIYGLTAFGLARDLSISQDEAGQFIDAYFLRYPSVKAYIQDQIALVKKTGFVTTISGRRRYLPQINNKNPAIRQLAERQAVNTPIQGSASDLIKLAMIKIHEQILTRRLESKMVLQIHDELVSEVVVKEMEEFCVLVKEKMEHVLALQVPIKVDMKKGQNWLEMEEVK